MFRRSDKIPIKKLVTLVGAAVLSLFFFITLGIQAFVTYRNSVLERQSYQDTIAHLVFDSIKQPLMQGSFFEAKARLQGSLERGQIDCVQLSFEALNFHDCRPGVGGKMAWTTIPLTQANEFSSYNGSLRLGFDQAKTQLIFWRQMAFILLISLVGTLLLRVLIGLGSRLFQREVDQLTTMLGQEKSRHFDFRTVEFGMLYGRLEELFAARTQLVENEVFATLAKSVAHDIRSPLSTLKIISEKGASLEMTPLLKAATVRLENIASHLLDDSVDKSNKANADLMVSLRQLVWEYKAKVPLVRFNLSGPDDALFSPVPSVELVALVDNLIKNAVEASHVTSIEIRLQRLEATLEIVVEDDGSGIPTEILAQIGQTPVTHGKVNGKGVGLFLICQKVRRWGGQLSFVSGDPRGTIARFSVGLGPAAMREERSSL